MKRISDKQWDRISESKPIRKTLIEKHGACMICGRGPHKPWKSLPMWASNLCCHEICCGKNRTRALDKPYAILVICGYCNQYIVVDKKKWPEARQLAVLQDKSDGYDLKAYNNLVNPNAPNRITQEEVDQL